MTPQASTNFPLSNSFLNEQYTRELSFFDSFNESFEMYSLRCSFVKCAIWRICFSKGSLLIRSMSKLSSSFNNTIFNLVFF